MEDTRFDKVLEKTLPKTILAKIASGFCGNTTGFEVLHLHTTNEHDKISTIGTYYYNDSGEEVPMSAIIKFAGVEEIEGQMVETESFIRCCRAIFKK